MPQEILPNRQQIQSQLDLLDQLEKNPHFQEFISYNQGLYTSGIATLLDLIPADLKDTNTREQLIGSIAELNKNLKYFSNLREDLNTQLNPPT